MEGKAKVLVTGGTGYIGSHTVVELLEAGYEVVIVDDLSNSEGFVIDRIEKITGTRPLFAQFDLCEKEKVNQFFQEQKPDAVIHFAASKAVGESVARPLHYYKNNLLSLVHLLEEMQQYGCKGMVFSSSCTVYGEPDRLPVDETSPIKKAASPYGNTKQIAEEIIADTLNIAPELQAISLRYFNPVGAHDSALIGELPRGVPNNLVPFITQTAIGLREELKVFGDDYNTPDGTCIRDYIHVVDLAKAHVTALGRMLDNQQTEQLEFFNLGTGTGSSVLEVIQSFEKVSGEKLNYRIVERRPGDVEKIYADTRFANETLGWKATRTLDDMMETAWAWQRAIAE